MYRRETNMKEGEMMKPKYDYSDVKLICPFCKCSMTFHDVLIGCLDLPYYVHYACVNEKCGYGLEIKFEEFDKRVKKRKLEEGG